MRAILFGLSLLLAAPLSAVDWKLREQYGAERLYSARTSSVSSHTVTGIGISYSLHAVGGTAAFEVKHSSIALADQNVNVSSTVYLVSGDIFNHKFDSIVENPLIYLKEITQPGVTVYIDINYLVPRGGGVR